MAISLKLHNKGTTSLQYFCQEFQWLSWGIRRLVYLGGDPVGKRRPASVSAIQQDNVGLFGLVGHIGSC